MFVRFANGLKNNAMDLCDNNNSEAFTKRIPCIVLMSLGSLDVLIRDLPFFNNENAVNISSKLSYKPLMIKSIVSHKTIINTLLTRFVHQ